MERLQPEAAFSSRVAPTELVEVTNPRHAEALQKLERGYEMATSEDGFRSYLKVIANLWQYSPRNMMMIFSQNPEASLVNSYDRWKNSGRQVKKGERGMQIFYPQHRFMEDENPHTGLPEKRKMLTGFGVGNVWDVAQTDGPPIVRPEPSDAFGTTDIAGEIDKRVSLFAIGEGLHLEKRKLPDNVRGYYSPMGSQIVLNESLPNDDGKLKTLMHETAHWKAGHGTTGHQGRDLSELVAEGSAFATLDYFGINTSMYSFDYLASWTRTPDVMKLAMPQIGQITKQLIGAINGEKIKEAEQWL